MKRKSIKIIALLLVLIFVLGGCGKAAEKASDKTSSESSESSKSTDSVRTYSVGETWEVEGLWKFKVNSVTTHFFCNTSTIQSQNSGQVVTISYTYENTGYEYISPLYITSSSFDLYDERGELAFVYNCDHVEHPKFCDKYFECTAQQVFVLKNYSSQLKLKVSYFNPETNGLSEAEFVLNITTSDTNNQSPIQSSESSSSSSPNTNNNPSNSTQPPATPSTPSTPTTPTQPSTPGHTHSYSAATCTTPAKCSCGATNGSALGHSYSNGKCVICGTSDPNYKTPDIILGEYIQKKRNKAI